MFVGVLTILPIDKVHADLAMGHKLRDLADHLTAGYTISKTTENIAQRCEQHTNQ